MVESVCEVYRYASGTVSPCRSQPAPGGFLISEGSKEHAATQNALARYLSDHGVTPLSPHAHDPQFDLAWSSQGRFAIAEVKSVRAENMVDQVRLGVGQVLHYAHQIAIRLGAEVPATVIVTSRPVTPELALYLGRNNIGYADAEALKNGGEVRLPYT